MSHRKLTLIALTLLVLVLAVAAGGCMSTSVIAPAGDIKKFSSAEEIRDYIKNNTQLAQDSYYRNGAGAPVPAPVAGAQETSAKGVSSTDAFPPAGGLGTTSYSQTNVQVTGVDEPDFVKNDARYIYVISGNTLTTVSYTHLTLPTNREV